MQSMRETAANAGASAKAGMEKAKASAQEKVDKMKTRDPNEKEMARERKEERKEHAEERKQEARDQNATARQVGGGHTASGYDKGDPRGYGDVNRGYTATGTGYGVDSRQVGYDDNVGYAGDRAGGDAYSTTGNQDYRSGEYENRNWEERKPNNAGTRRNTGIVEDDPYGSYQ